MGNAQPSAKRPGKGRGLGPVPRGIEVLVHKAAVDAEFKALLLERRAGAAAEIGLRLSPPEALLLDSIPAAQLEAVIASTRVSPDNRRAFLGKAAAVMLAALGAVACDRKPVPKGIKPDRPRRKTQPTAQSKAATKGIRPD